MDDGFGCIDGLILQRAVMSSSMAMAVTDPFQPDNPIVFTNPAFSQLTGYDAGDIVGRNCRFLQGTDTDPASVAAISKALAARTDLQIDILNYRSNGSRFTNRLFISPVLNSKGELVHYFASQLDATELVRENAIKRRREDVLRYLVGELGQRLGSTIQIVQALVSETLASASSVLEASDAITARLVALGQAHSRIAKNDWEREDFESLVNETIAPFRQHFATLQVEGPRLRLDAFLSLKLASALYELSLSPTLRKSGKARSVRVEWTTSGDREGQQLRFSWHEQEPTRLTQAETIKLRRTVATIMNDPDVNVSLCADDERSGLVCRIATPLSKDTI